MPQPRTAATLRARVRAEMVEEIKRTARRHLAEQGAPNLSLRAVAREMGFVSSAVYRYFASRDELLTALIIDAYDSLGEAAEAAESRVDREDLAGRFRAVCHAVRDWARANPHEYALIYGSPVPGYRAPQDTIGPATRITTLLGQIIVDGARHRTIAAPRDDRLPPAVRREMTHLAERAFPGVPPTVLARGLFVWTQLFGAVTFELFGRLESIIDDRDSWFDHQVSVMVNHVGLSERTTPTRRAKRA